MVAIDHELTGALIAVGVKDPWLAVPLAFVSHFVLDMLPHWWLQVENGNVRARNSRLIFKVVTRTDFFLSAVGVIVLPLTLRTTTQWWVVLLSVIAASLPDYYWVYLFFKDQRSGVLTKKSGLIKFHKQIQWLERPWALPIDLAWLVTCTILIGVVR